MNSCGAPRCTNRTFKNSSRINYNKNVIITISRHIQNPGISNICGIFKTLSNILDDGAYWDPWHSQSSLFRQTLEHSARFNHSQPYWGTLRHTEAYSDIIEAYQAIHDFFIRKSFTGKWASKPTKTLRQC